MLQPTTRAARRFACSAHIQGVLRQGGQSTDVAAAESARRQVLATRPPAAAQRRCFSATALCQQSDGNSASSPSSSSEVPWYLRVDVPRHPTLVPEDQPLPAIPAGAPALMQPLLSFVAEDLGLDDLALLDLRELDPPAALGPDLLMLFGTARSDRHLHVSADRLVRWLRGRGIHANADGLMGRNELKVKLRRKARRAKLMGTDRLDAVATRGGGAVDDGISTQWVCVHAGTQQGPVAQEGPSVDAEGRTSGFGTVRPGTTVVVQMLTEAKRQQLDLETLWTRALARSLRRRIADGEDIGEEGLAVLASLPQKQQSDAQNSPSAATEAANGLDDEQPILSPSSISWSAERPSQPQNPLQQQQRREFSCSARRAATTSEDVVARLTQPQLSISDLSWIEKELASDRATKVRLLEHLTIYLGRLRKPEVLEALGLTRDYGSKGSAPGFAGSAPTAQRPPLSAKTPFVRAARYCMDGLPAADTWAFRAWLHATMLDLAHHRAYTLEGLDALVQEMERGGLPMSRDLCAHLLKGIFAVRIHSTLTLERQAEIALRLLNIVHERGEPILAGDFLVAALTSLARTNHRLGPRTPADVSTAAATDTLGRSGGAAVKRLERVPGMASGPSVEVADMAAAALAEEAEAVASASAVSADPADALQTVLERLMRQAQLPCPGDAALQQLLRAYALQNDWARFWATWRLPAQHGQRRGEAQYAFLFQRLAQTRHRALCTEALRNCVPEMLSEDPPVQPVGTVLAALKACVAVADPHAEALAQNLAAVNTDGPQGLRLANREFVKLLRAVEAMNQGV